MGNRSRNGSHKGKEERKNKLQLALKEFTRTKALRELNNGADPNDRKFVQHRNYHVRMRAWVLAGSVVPANPTDRQALQESLSKGRTAAGKLAVDKLFETNAEAVAA